MPKQITRRILPLLTAILLGLSVAAQSSGNSSSARWQPVETPRESAWVLTADEADGAKIDVVVREGGQVLITANKATPVKVFTILGQPVASRTVQAGTMRLRLPLRGIYILKAGETTKRINI